jgi:hypothetical protein
VDVFHFAEARLADECDAAQERGEVAGKGQPSNVPDGNIKPATVEDFGLSRKQVHEARQVRDAERAAQSRGRSPCLDQEPQRGTDSTTPLVLGKNPMLSQPEGTAGTMSAAFGLLS